MNDYFFANLGAQPYSTSIGYSSSVFGKLGGLVILATILVLTTVYLIYKLRVRSSGRQNEILDKGVKERAQELVEQIDDVCILGIRVKKPQK